MLSAASWLELLYQCPVGWTELTRGLLVLLRTATVAVPDALWTRVFRDLSCRGSHYVPRPPPFRFELTLPTPLFVSSIRIDSLLLLPFRTLLQPLSLSAPASSHPPSEGCRGSGSRDLTLFPSEPAIASAMGKAGVLGTGTAVPGDVPVPGPRNRPPALSVRTGTDPLPSGNPPFFLRKRSA